MASSVGELIENGGARREPHASPMLKDRFVARCQRRRRSLESDAIIFVSRRGVCSSDSEGQEPSSVITYLPRMRALNMTVTGSASARYPSGSRDSRSRSTFRNCGSPRAMGGP